MQVSIRRSASSSIGVVLTVPCIEVARADRLPIFYARHIGNTAIDNLCTDNDIIDRAANTDGGGIHFNGNGGFARTVVLGNTHINYNIAANSGGGARVSGDAFMSMLCDSP